MMLFVCVRGRNPVRDLLVPPIEIPSLAKCAQDLERVLDECLKEAADMLCVPRVRLSTSMRECIMLHAESIPDLEKATLRLVALKSSLNMTQAAARLDMAHVSLSRWVLRRPWAEELLKR